MDLAQLVKKKMEDEKLSLRAAGKQAGVAHTTIDRILKGEQVDLSTMEKVSQWVEIPVSDALDLKSGDKGLQGDIASLVGLHPELGEVFSTLANEIFKGNLDSTILAEITGFASFRLQKYREKRGG